GVEADAVGFLPHLDAAWQSHCEQVWLLFRPWLPCLIAGRLSRQLVIIRSIFLFLDRTFVINTRVKSLWEAGLQLFGQHFKGTCPSVFPSLDRVWLSSFALAVRCSLASVPFVCFLVSPGRLEALYFLCHSDLPAA